MASSLKFFVLILSVTLLKLSLPANGQAKTTIGDKEYYISMTSKANWYKANHVCTAYGMSLASIESATEWQNLKTFLSTNSISGNTYWLSGSNLADSTVYTWLSSGNAFSYTNWAASQPTSGGTDLCVSTDSDFKWTTIACNTAYYFICSKPVIPDCGVNGRCTYSYN